MRLHEIVNIVPGHITGDIIAGISRKTINRILKTYENIYGDTNGFSMDPSDVYSPTAIDDILDELHIWLSDIKADNPVFKSQSGKLCRFMINYLSSISQTD